MEIEVIDLTDNPVDIIAMAAGTSTGRTFVGSIDDRVSRVRNCYKNGHMSVFEFAHISFFVKDISRACSHQLVRHRLCSFCQQSQRYTVVDTESDDWYTIPDCILVDEALRASYTNEIKRAGEIYASMLKSGVSAEDARYILPEATKTSITVGFNLREFYHFLDLRTDKHAQSEIRTLAKEMKRCAGRYGTQWGWLMNIYDGNDGFIPV